MNVVASRQHIQEEAWVEAPWWLLWLERWSLVSHKLAYHLLQLSEGPLDHVVGAC